MSFIHKITEEIFFSKAQLYNDPFLFTIKNQFPPEIFHCDLEQKKGRLTQKLKVISASGGGGKLHLGGTWTLRQICEVFFTIE